MAKKNVASELYSVAKMSKDDQGKYHINAKDLAKLIKFKLGEKFPGVKFGVKSRVSAIDISYENGPPSSVVDEFVGQFSFGGFDGMIDLSYSSDNWFLKDGSMVPASSSGTQGSMGVYEAFSTDCPEPGAVLVSCYVKYIHAQNHLDDDFWSLLKHACALQHGHKIQSVESRSDEYVESQDAFLSSLTWKFYGKVYRSGGEAAYADPCYVQKVCQEMLAASTLDVSGEIEDQATDELVDEFIAEQWL